MKLDLHGIKHQDVEVLVEDFIMINQPPLSIITGNSKAMQNKVIAMLEKHDFKWVIKASNLGEIIVL